MTNKEIALDFLKHAARGDSRVAFNLYTGKNFKHHNAWFKGDAQTLIVAMEESAKANPDKIFEIQRALQDEDLVSVHSFIKQNPKDRGMAVMHIFRFEKNKIIEMWDFGQAIPENCVNENGMF